VSGAPQLSEGDAKQTDHDGRDIRFDDGSAQRSAPDLGRRGDTNLVFAVEVELGTG
jgi:hypothetical protein